MAKNKFTKKEETIEIKEEVKEEINILTPPQFKNFVEAKYKSVALRLVAANLNDMVFNCLKDKTEEKSIEFLEVFIEQVGRGIRRVDTFEFIINTIYLSVIGNEDASIVY